ncbi:2-oxoglutarate dehydrogenase C-terminal domain-containing protein [Forsythia ovata]|uniref:2-oxoglutarate dehydrogenase C-terminal domain-containing protein n=1 Tax=Forsythia ovata TaxID=205694 RepID=A0ABD1WSJ4_9LAMI
MKPMMEIREPESNKRKSSTPKSVLELMNVKDLTLAHVKSHLQIYYELDEERKKVNGKDIAICRVEQLCPFPYDLIQWELKRYLNAEIVWCQQEPMNMGANNYIAPRLCTVMKALGMGNMDDIKYAGRAPSATTTTGFLTIHFKEQTKLIQKAINRIIFIDIIFGVTILNELRKTLRIINTITHCRYPYVAALLMKFR